MRAWLDGIQVTELPEALQYPTFTLRKQDETGESAFSFTGDLIFVGKEYTYLYQKLKTDPNALTNKVVLRFEHNCCAVPQVYEFYIESRGLKWCEGEGSCQITAAAVEKSNSNDQLTCLKNTLIYDNYAGFQNKQHPRMSYCNEIRPNWMHDLLIIISLATATSLLALAPIIAGMILLFNTINTVIGLLNGLLPSSSQINQLSLGGLTNITPADVMNYYNLLVALIVGCGRKHPSPLVRDYAQNVCGKCGLAFSSSIYNTPGSPYFNTVYFNAPIDKGTLETDTTTYWIDENKPLLNGTKFFNKLKAPHNADWRIQNNVLYFERRDFFVPKTPWLDLTTYDPNKITQVCWNWSSKARYSYGQFYYLKDAVNWVGAEARNRWGDIVDWNIPYSSLQKDVLEPLIEFGACRFRDDGVDRDVLSTYKNFPTIGSIIKKYDGVILMNSHTAYEPMLLAWDPASGVANGKVSGTAYNFPGFPKVGPNQFFNYQFWFKEGYPGNLYEDFWKIEDPKSTNYQGLDFVAELEYDCALLDAVDLDGFINTSEGIGKVTQIVINFGQNKMIITGTV